MGARAPGSAFAVGVMALLACSSHVPSGPTGPSPGMTRPIVVPLQAPAFQFSGAPVAGKPFASQLSALGGRPPYRWALSAGKLPAGWTLDPNGDWYGITSQTGSFAFNVTLTDADGTTLSGLNPVNGVIDPSGTVPFVIGTLTLPTFGEGGAFGFEPFVEGGTPPYVFSVTGLPAGVSLDPSTGTLMGQPTVTGSFTLVYTLKDSLGTVASNSPLTLDVSVEAPQPVGGGGDASAGGTCTSDGDCTSTSICGNNPGAPNNGGVCGADGLCHCCFAMCSVDPQTGAVSGCSCIGLGCGTAAAMCENQVGYACIGSTCATTAGLPP